jgi:putative copper resistance protein D
VQWSRDDEKEERRRERHSRRGGSDDADMDEYNAYLAELDRRSRGLRPTGADGAAQTANEAADTDAAKDG